MYLVRAGNHRLAFVVVVVDGAVVVVVVVEHVGGGGELLHTPTLGAVGARARISPKNYLNENWFICNSCTSSFAEVRGT